MSAPSPQMPMGVYVGWKSLLFPRRVLLSLAASSSLSRLRAVVLVNRQGIGLDYRHFHITLVNNCPSAASPSLPCPPYGSAAGVKVYKLIPRFYVQYLKQPIAKGIGLCPVCAAL